MNHETLLASKILGVKMATLLTGLSGGITIGSLYIPQKVLDKGIFLAGAIVAFSSLMLAGIFTQVLIEVFGIDPKFETAIAFTIGGLALSIINWITNWLRHTEDYDITDVAEEIKEELSKNKDNK